MLRLRGLEQLQGGFAQDAGLPTRLRIAQRHDTSLEVDIAPSETLPFLAAVLRHVAQKLTATKSGQREQPDSQDGRG